MTIKEPTPTVGPGPAFRLRVWFRRHPIIGDALLALGFATIGATYAIAAFNAAGVPPMTIGTFLWVLVGAVPIIIRRTHVWLSVIMVTAIEWTSLIDDLAWLTLNYSIFVVAYTAAAYLPIRQALAAQLTMWGTLTGLFLFVFPPEQTGMPVSTALILNYISASIFFGIGRVVYNRRRMIRDLNERARLAEANQQAMAEQAVADERRRIARELHDVVAHHIAVMGVLATGARRVLAKDPAKADEALETIEQTGRATLREMRRLLDVLRTSSEDNDDDLTPQPNLDAIHALVAQIRETGLPVSLVIEGKPYPLDPGIALTVFRIIQEALTNTLKHAGHARATVRINYEDDRIQLEVSDNGLGPRASSDPSRVGHGLVGMRERVALYGGTLRTGPRPGGGFRIHTMIPIDAASQVLGAQQGAEQ